MNIWTWILCSICYFPACIQGSTIDDLRGPPKYSAEVDSGIHGTYPTVVFQSFGIPAPRTNFVRWSPQCNDGLYYFISPRGTKVSHPGPMILDSNGTLIWTEYFKNAYGGHVYDLKIQEYKGEKVLTFWLGNDRFKAHGQGQYLILNSSYEVIRTVDAANGLKADLHDLIITQAGTAILIAYQVVKFDVRSAGRRFDDVWNQAIWDGLVQEFDIESGELVFEWRASEHIDIAKSYRKIVDPADGTREKPYQPFLLDSVAKDSRGNYLVSARNMHAIYYIHGTTKKIIWTLGGRSNQFMDLSDGLALSFAWQHDARLVAKSAFPESYEPLNDKEAVTTSLLTMFDNAAVDRDHYWGLSRSRGLLLEITYPTPGFESRHAIANLGSIRASSASPPHLSDQDKEKVRHINGTDLAYTVRLVKQWNSPEQLVSGSQGSLQLLPQRSRTDPIVLLGYGMNAAVTTFGSDGSVLCNLHFGATTSWERGDIQSDRAVKASWRGQPSKPPVAVFKREQIFVSWNGATEVAAWVLQGSETGEGETTWNDLSTTIKDGFETRIQLSQAQLSNRYLRLRALDDHGQNCEHGVSNAIVPRARMSRVLNQHLNPHAASFTESFLIILGAIAGLAILYQLLLRFLSWRHGRPHGGPSWWKSR